jgi:hypothetical protein
VIFLVINLLIVELHSQNSGKIIFLKWEHSDITNYVNGNHNWQLVASVIYLMGNWKVYNMWHDHMCQCCKLVAT